MARAVSLAIGALALGALAGCGYPEFGFEPADALLDSSAIDAFVDDTLADDTNEETSGADAGDDANPADVTVTDSAKPDAMVDAPSDTIVADAGPAGCTGSHVFCDDFESSSKPETKWDEGYILGGTLSLDTATYWSKTHSLQATVPSTTSVEVAGSVDKVFMAAASTTAMRLDFYLKLDAAYSGAGMLLAKLQKGPTGRGIELGVGASGIYVALLGNGSYKSFVAKAVSPGKWIHVRLEGKTVVDTSGYAKLWIDDALVVDASGWSTTDTTSVATKIVLGLYTNETSAVSYAAHYDNVTFDWL